MQQDAVNFSERQKDEVCHPLSTFADFEVRVPAPLLNVHTKQEAKLEAALVDIPVSTMLSCLVEQHLSTSLLLWSATASFNLST